MRMLSNRACGLNNLARKGDALATLHFGAKAAIGAFGMARPGARRIADIGFTQGIANADNHATQLA